MSSRESIEQFFGWEVVASCGHQTTKEDKSKWHYWKQKQWGTVMIIRGWLCPKCAREQRAIEADSWEEARRKLGLV